MHGYSNGGGASSDINHPGQRIAGLLAEGSNRICSGDNSTKRVTRLKQR